MAQLAIKGHATRGKDVIEILEMLGGMNKHNYSAVCGSLCFYIGKENNIIYYDWVDCCEDEDILVFTLEEFLEKFPYKVGDKVKDAIIEDYVGTIIEAQWDNYEEEVVYTVIWDNRKELSYFAKDLQPYKEETMDRKYNVEEYLQVWEETEKGLEVVVNDRFELKEDNGKFYIIKKQPQYPKTYVECAKILDCFGAAHIDGYKGELLDKLQELLICRDAYWKIAGDWKPDEEKNDGEFIYCISYQFDEFELSDELLGDNYILSFPTAEMRDVFYENFKELIEECKEFL